MNNGFELYVFTFFTSLMLALILTPAARAAAIVLNIIDHPSSTIKTHKEPVPYLGGVAIFLAFAFSLLWIRVITSFPTGTLRSLRGVLFGGAIVFLIGLIDDVKHHGLHYRSKFFFQTAAALIVMTFGLRIKFIQPSWLAAGITIVWVVGVTNAFNLIDIMDGLASGVAFVASVAFLIISLPTEEIYVNFAAAALAGACLGFLPYNLSTSVRIFMGDSGSLFLGFVSASLAMGTSYGEKTEWGVIAPLLILALPIFDTLFVMLIRIKKGISPFLGSKDHFPLRLEMLGWSRKSILVFSLIVGSLLAVGAYFCTQGPTSQVLSIYAVVLLSISAFAIFLLKK